MDKLIVGNIEPLEPLRETLHIDFIKQEQKWQFKYYTQPLRSVEFERYYAAEKGIEKFDNFIKMINW